tara:strand:- start:94 stop:804 length:711 start_codon:yes stop_codon:yes gene_type:complete
MDIALSELARMSEQLISNGLKQPGPFTFALVFAGGFLTSLGPCSLSLLPVTVAYLAGFDTQKNPFIRSFSFCGGIVLSLVILGSISSLIGRIYGQVPIALPGLVSVLAILMGLNLLGLLKIPLPSGPNPNVWSSKVPGQIAPIAAGLAFGLAASPCTTPVLAVLLGWISQNQNPIEGILFLACFGFGQVLPLLIAGSAAATVPNFLAFRPIGRWIPPISGMIFLTTGILSLVANWI